MRKEVFEIEFDYLPFWLSIFKRLCRAEKREQNLTREERFKSHMLVGGKYGERALTQNRLLIQHNLLRKKRGLTEQTKESLVV